MNTEKFDISLYYGSKFSEKFDISYYYGKASKFSGLIFAAFDPSFAEIYANLALTNLTTGMAAKATPNVPTTPTIIYAV